MKKQNIAYPYIPNSDPRIKKSMLKEIGVRDAMDLYKDIPEKLKLNRELKLPEPILDEHSLRTHVDKLIGKKELKLILIILNIIMILLLFID